MWLRPPFASAIALAAYYALAYVLYDAAATFVYMPYYALTPELSGDYDERTSLTTFRMFFSILGSLVAFTVPLAIVGRFAPEHAPRVLLMAAGFGLASAAPLLLVFWGTRERREFMELPQPSLRQSLHAAVRNRPFIFSVGIFLFTWVAVDILQSTLLYFVKYIVVRESQSDLIMATIFVVALLALPVWNLASRRWNKKWAYVAGIAFWAVVQLVLVTLGPASSDGLILALCVMAGIGVGAAHILPWSIIPDAIEWDELQTGERHEGMYYSLVTLAQKVASSIAIPLVLLVLQVTGYVPTSSEQPARALIGIRIAVGPIPAALLCAGIVFAIVYPLGRERYQAVARELAARRASHREPNP